jgi:hypothetical protein
VLQVQTRMQSHGADQTRSWPCPPSPEGGTAPLRPPAPHVSVAQETAREHLAGRQPSPMPHLAIVAPTDAAERKRPSLHAHATGGFAASTDSLSSAARRPDEGPGGGNGCACTTLVMAMGTATAVGVALSAGCATTT